MQTLIMLLCGTLGGLLFLWLEIPGGSMVGAAMATMLFFALMPSGRLRVSVPPAVEHSVDILMGIIIGSMFQPELFGLFWNNWLPILLSTLAILGGGLLGAAVLYHCGVFRSMGAYLASSPGGLNAVIGIAAEVGEDAPLILLCQMVRLYVILLLTPFVFKSLSLFLAS